MKKVSLEKFVEDCRRIRDLVEEAVPDSDLPYICVRGLRSGIKIVNDAITYFSGDARQRNHEEDASRLQTTEFGLQTLRDSCEIAEEEYGKEALKDLREIIRLVGGYSIETGQLQYSFSRVIVTPKDEALLEAAFPIQKPDQYSRSN